MLARFFFIMLIYSIVRTIFYANNLSYFSNHEFADLFFSYATGLRFDLSALALINAPLLLAIPYWKTPFFQRYLCFWFRLYFILVNSLFVSLNIFDSEYYKFSAKRLTASSFLIVTDMENQLGAYITDYWPFSLAIVIATVAIILFDRRVQSREQNKTIIWYRAIGQQLLVIVAIAVAARGGWQIKPLIPAFAYQNQSPAFGQLSLNSTFTILKSIKKPGLTPVAYFQSWEETKGLLAKRPILSGSSAMLPEDSNVMIIILESFGSEYVGQDTDLSYTPFLNQLEKKGVSFQTHYANGRRSIDAMPAIFAGIPAWMPNPYITSPYQSNLLNPLPRLFGSRGYETIFFHGGENGTMFFDVMAGQFGFDQYIGAKEYPNSGDHDGRWGIFDEPFMQYALQFLDESEHPFFASIFTLSSHQPYTIPEQYKNRFPKGTLPIHESVGYSDYALKKFFEVARTKPWYKNTLFILTADHSSLSDNLAFQNDYGRYRVPLIFYHPTADLSSLDPGSIAQHIDIYPSLIDMFGWTGPDQMPRFGSSLRINKDRFVILGTGPTYHIQQGTQKWSLTIPQSFTDETRAQQKKQEQVQATLQYFHNGMIDNKLVW
ncbi:MAG: sulfatase-like hydrolase/transferase [Pseudobacteriovorax sp.]|nr:sulfatase-like hydrolase/transferase [Pseudobacteriovorax sp.]